MHIWGIETNEIAATFLCPSCRDEVGMSLDQLEMMIERNDFTFFCPRNSVFVQLNPKLVLESYEKALSQHQK